MKAKEVSRTQRTLNVWAISVFIWSLYRYYFKTTLPIWFDEFIAKPVVFLGPLAYYIAKYERLNFLQAVDFKTKNITKEIIFGVVIGMVFFVSGTLGYWSRFNTIAILRNMNIETIAYFTIISFASSINEEILSRGFVLKRLYDESRNIFTSSFFASFLFFFLHVPILFSNPKMTGVLLIQVMVTDLILSLAVSLLYIQRKNVIVPILIHAFYNMSIYLFILK